MKHKKLTQTGLLTNVEVYRPIKLIGKIIGYPLIVYGVATLWHPFSASIGAIAIGCLLTGIEYKKLMRSIKFYIKKSIDWIYGNRNLKLIKRTLKLRLM